MENNNEIIKMKRVYTQEDIKEVQENNSLLGVAIRLPCICNFSCSYCNAKVDNSMLNYEKILSFINQAIELGIKSVSFVGEGEPLLYKGMYEGKEITLYDIIEYLSERKVQSIIYTNNSLISKEVAQKLLNYDVVLVAKQNSLRKEVQEKITGKGTYDLLLKGFNNMIEAGFNLKNRMSVHTVVCKDNIDEIPTMWRQWRQLNIMPQVQIMSTPTIKEKEESLQVEKEQVKELFYKLLEIDQTEFGLDWIPRPPIAPYGCNVFYTSCGLRPNGDISICAYSDNVIGNILNESLKDILNKEYVKAMRVINEKLTGKCSECDLNRKLKCYGCRTHQICLNGDVFSSYDFCWK